jgi:hypothetical protein
VMGIEIAALHYSRIKLNESDKKTQDFHWRKKETVL